MPQSSKKKKKCFQSARQKGGFSVDMHYINEMVSEPLLPWRSTFQNKSRQGAACVCLNQSVLEQKKKSAVQSKMTLKGMLGQRLGCRTSRLRSKFIWSAVSMPWIMAAPLPYRRRISDVRLDPGRSVGAAAVLSFWSPLTERKHKSTEFILKIKVCESVRPCPLISVGWFLNEWANHWYREKKKILPLARLE